MEKKLNNNKGKTYHAFPTSKKHIMQRINVKSTQNPKNLSIYTKSKRRKNVSPNLDLVFLARIRANKP